MYLALVLLINGGGELLCIYEKSKVIFLEASLATEPG